MDQTGISVTPMIKILPVNFQVHYFGKDDLNFHWILQDPRHVRFSVNISQVTDLQKDGITPLTKTQLIKHFYVFPFHCAVLSFSLIFCMTSFPSLGPSANVTLSVKLSLILLDRFPLSCLCSFDTLHIPMVLTPFLAVTVLVQASQCPFAATLH